MNKNYLLLPGFPAVASYYKRWAEEIKSKNTITQVLYAESDVLFSKKLDFKEYDQAMISHYENMFLSLSGPITIIAHSTGGYFALKILERHPEKIEKVILICPYIGNSTVKFFKYASIPYFIDRLFPLSQTISLFISLFKRHFDNLNKLSTKELNVYFRFGFKQNTCFNKIPFDINKISKFKEKIFLYYIKNDKWCPSSTIELLKPISNSKQLSIAHDFIIYEDQRHRMIEELCL
jgi:pimeloyl-ACP methyl ester carboxylesterase